MESASKIFSYLILSLLVFSCGSSNLETNNSPSSEKAYVLLRSEGSEIEINRLSGILNSDFKSKNLQSNIVYYPPGKEWDINEIFTNSYNNDFNYIVLIDQVAKFTMDGKTNVGGKYQIRSYNIKSENPDWNDLGQKTCNVSVKESVAKFSRQIVNSVLSLSNLNNSNALAKDSIAGSKITGIDYNNLKSSSDYDAQIAELKIQLEAEKTKTDDAIRKKEKLSKEYQSRLSTKKEQNKSIVVGLDGLRKEIEREEKLKQEEEIAMDDVAEVKRKEELRLAEQKIRLDKKFLKDGKEQKIQKNNKEKIVESDQKTSKKVRAENKQTIAVLSGSENGDLDRINVQKESSENKQNSGIYSQPADKDFESDVFLVIIGFEKDLKRLKDLKDHLEFDFLFANLKTKSTLFNKSTTIDKTNFLNWNKDKFQHLILIEQLESINDDESNFQLSIHSHSMPDSWVEIDDVHINLSDRASLKNFSKKVLKLLR